MLDIKKFKTNYYFSSFYWSTISKVLNAIFGFISVPLLLGYYGKADYGLLSIATACNGYMSLMDLGMNTGAVKYFSQWKVEGKTNLINRVSRTNVSFYLIVSLFNIFGLLALAFWGEGLFSVTHDQFMQLRLCFFILCVFSSISWISSAYSQLLVANKQFSFTMKIQCLLVLLRMLLLSFIFIFRLSITTYFFFLTLIVSIAIFPYSYKCKVDGLVDSLKPATYWKDFKVVFSFSLALFALSLFQVTATQSRPIILSMFARDGAECVAEFRILEVVPSFIIMICGSFLSIFLPKTTEIYTNGNQKTISSFVYRWTSLTTILVCLLSFPFVIGSKEILSAYIGPEVLHLSKWLALWGLFLVIQMHSTPVYSMILSLGKTKPLVVSTAICCILSIIINISLCKIFPVGSAVIGYIIYLSLLSAFSYFYYYKRYLHLDRIKVFGEFFRPTLVAVVTGGIVYLINIELFEDAFVADEKVYYLLLFLVKAMIWVVLYLLTLYIFRIVSFKQLKEVI